MEKEISVVDDKKKRVKKELAKLKKVFSVMDEQKKKATEALLNNIAFMSVELDDLQLDIQTNGATEIYNNGRQVCTKASASMQVYNATLKGYNTSIKMLLSQLDAEAKSEAKNSLVDFIKQ